MLFIHKNKARSSGDRLEVPEGKKLELSVQIPGLTAGDEITVDPATIGLVETSFMVNNQNTPKGEDTCLHLESKNPLEADDAGRIRIMGPTPTNPLGILGELEIVIGPPVAKVQTSTKTEVTEPQKTKVITEEVKNKKKEKKHLSWMITIPLMMAVIGIFCLCCSLVGLIGYFTWPDPPTTFKTTSKTSEDTVDAGTDSTNSSKTSEDTVDAGTDSTNNTPSRD